MFLFGILSSPLPYLLMAVFYFFGFATGMFKGNADNETVEQIQNKNIQVENQTKSLDFAECTFQFHDYRKTQKINEYFAVQSVQPIAVRLKEKLIYIVHDIKVDRSNCFEIYFSRPPPANS